MVAFIELKNQVVEVKDEVKANKSVLRELRSELVDVKSETCSTATKLNSIKLEMTSARSTSSSGPMVGFSSTTTDFPELPRPADGFSRAEKTASTGVHPTISNGDSSKFKTTFGCTTDAET